MIPASNQGALLTDGIYVVLTDDTGYSKTQLSTLFTPTISSNAVANLKNCVGSIRATLQSQYSFTTDDTTGEKGFSGLVMTLD